MKGMLRIDGKMLCVEPKMHVSGQMFDVMCRDAERAGLMTIGFPKKKGGRSVLLGV
jgi:hypothetical protein